jgi:hypothetical protein
MRLRYAEVGLSLAVLVAVSACSPTDSTGPNGIPRTGPLMHLTESACAPGVASLVLSAYPSQVEVGQQSVFYVSFLDGSGESVPAVDLTWTIADTTIVTRSVDQASGRPAGLAKRGGTTTVTANCGSISASATLTVAGGNSVETTPTTTVEVTIPTSVLAPGQTTQAEVHIKDATGNNIVATDTAWSTANTGVATVTDAGMVTGVSGGTTTVTASIEGVSGGASLVVSATPTTPTTPTPNPDPGSGVGAVAPELPRAQVDARYVAPTGRTINVRSGGDLQQAINSAERGDLILLDPGASYVGPFDLPAKPGAGWITIRTAAPDGAIPGQGQRITPAYASQMPTLVGGSANAPVLRTTAGATGYRIVGVEITAYSWVGNLTSLVELGEGGYYQKSLSDIPSALVLDRVYVHGQSTTNLQRCIALNSASTAIVNSWISDCHARALDSQAIAGWNGPGPYLIENNLLEGAGENVMFGGADAVIANLSPSDITLRRNHVRKPPEWKGVWTVKNLFELKHAKRVLVEGNVFENNWADAQAGMAIVLKSTNQGGTNPWAQTADVTFRYNIIRDTPQGVGIAAAPDQYTAAMVAVPAARFRFEHNLFENIGTYNGTTNGNAVTLSNNLSDVMFAHNTVAFNYDEGLFAMLEAWGAARNIVINDNVVGKSRYYSIMHSGIKVGIESMNAFAGSQWSFDRNVVVGVGADYVSWHPQSSFYPRAMGDVGFSSSSNGNYRLSPASPYKGKGTDGTDPGVNFDELDRLTSGVAIR